MIGGTAAGTRNLISGNVGSGVEITGSGTSGNVVAGDFIGTDVTGATPRMTTTVTRWETPTTAYRSTAAQRITRSAAWRPAPAT